MEEGCSGSDSRAGKGPCCFHKAGLDQSSIRLPRTPVVESADVGGVRDRHCGGPRQHLWLGACRAGGLPHDFEETATPSFVRWTCPTRLGINTPLLPHTAVYSS